MAAASIASTYTDYAILRSIFRAISNNSNAKEELGADLIEKLNNFSFDWQCENRKIFDAQLRPIYEECKDHLGFENRLLADHCVINKIE